MKNISKTIKKQEFLLAFIFSFILLSLIIIGRVGPEYDELIPVNAALNCPTSIFLVYAKRIGSQCLPIMLSSYIGGLVALPYKISFLLLPPSLQVFRLTNVIISTISIILIFYSVKKLTNNKIASLAIFFLVFDIQFLLTGQISPITTVPFFLRSLFIYIFSILRENRLKYFLLGLLAGLAFYTKLDAFFVFFPVFISIIFFSGKTYNKYKKIFYGVFGSTIGALPLIIYTIKTYEQTQIFSLASSLSNNYQSVIGYKIYQYIFQLISPDWFSYFFDKNFSIPIFIKILAVFISIILIYSSIKLLSLNKFKWLGTSFLIFLIFYLFFRGLILPHHRFNIYPIPQIILAFSFLVIKNKKMLFTIIFVYLILFAYSFNTFMSITKTNCGRKSASCEIFSLYGQLKDEKETIVIGDWGISTQLLLLSAGKLNIREASYILNTSTYEETVEYLKPFLTSCSPIVLHKPEQVFFSYANENVEKVIEKYPQYKLKKLEGIEYQIFTCKDY